MKKSILFGIILTIMMLAVPGAIATATFVTPGASATISGSSYVVNVTSNIANLENCSITASSALSGDSLTTTWLINETGSEANATINTSTLEDASDWIFAGTCYNTTGSTDTITSRTGITIDNTAPTAPSSIAPTTTTNKGSISFSSTVVGATTTGCTLTATSNYHSQTWTMDHSGNTCTDTISLPGGGEYSIAIIASDGLNESEGTSTLVVDDSNGGIYIPPSRNAEANGDADEPDGKKNFLIFAALVFVAYLLFGKKNNSGNTARRKRK